MANIRHIVEQSKEERLRITLAMSEIVQRDGLIPPFSLEALKQKLEEISPKIGIAKELYNWALIMLNNEIWRKEFAKVDYDKRILLLPQCLRKQGTCIAKFDSIGLLCEACGNCKIDGLLNLAEDLDMLSVVSDSTSSVQALFESGKVEAVIGVSCLKSMEKSFENLLKQGVAAMAIPLLKDGCKDTDVDAKEVMEIMKLKISGKPFLNFIEIKNEVQTWFSIDRLREHIEISGDICEVEGLEYLSQAGNRWRPSLLVSVYFALTNEPIENVAKLAIAIECFHKASLILDDIEDDDDFRDGILNLHKKLGLSQAINVGDWLIGLGYDLVSSFPAKRNLVSLVAKVHRYLCQGQGQDLANYKDLSLAETLDIYAKKTSKAFGLSLSLALALSDFYEDYAEILEEFAENFGIAYQLYDDIRDLEIDENISMIYTLTKEFGAENARAKLHNLYEEYLAKAYKSLEKLNNVSLKRLLFSAMGKVFKDV
ncbi:MAG: polyprenyl synthetase family protein [Opitutales bacterium]